jgi:ABC-type uncharacterized transport system ATPase subunit
MPAAFGLEAVAMTKRFGAFLALDDVSLDVAPGSFHALLGENGAGKSTLVKCIMGYYRPDQGRVIVGGREQAIASPRAAHALGLGMVYQHFTLVPAMTVAENLVMSRAALPLVIDWRVEKEALASFLAGMPFRVPFDAENLAFRGFDRPPFSLAWLRPAKMRAEALRRIARYRIRTRSPDAPLAALSGGNVQRTVLARELDGGAEVMIAANPCFGLDFSAVAQIHAEIMAARNRGAAVLLVSSDLDEILELADRLVVMFNGRVVHETRVGDADLTEIGRHMAGH